ncbi:hypothetical protein BaRGS_00035865 [Batillaria attramentaria]|uniref:Uncharacterized protein n=1 Tax=Batillaria attramentaria TaxID=370345 RepID=A0ABD0JDE3_9CAEN
MPQHQFYGNRVVNKLSSWLLRLRLWEKPQGGVVLQVTYTVTLLFSLNRLAAVRRTEVPVLVGRFSLRLTDHSRRSECPMRYFVSLV